MVDGFETKAVHFRIKPEIDDLPHVTRAGADSSLIQNDIHETMTHRTEGM